MMKRMIEKRVNERDRLIELLKEADKRLVYFEEKACHLLKNGVVVQPCRVWDKTFLLLESDSNEYEIYESKCVRITDNGYGVYYSMAFDCPEIGNTLAFGISDFGKAVFLTREEAEKALAERSK